MTLAKCTRSSFERMIEKIKIHAKGQSKIVKISITNQNAPHMLLTSKHTKQIN